MFDFVLICNCYVEFSTQQLRCCNVLFGNNNIAYNNIICSAVQWQNANSDGLQSGGALTRTDKKIHSVRTQNVSFLSVIKPPHGGRLGVSKGTASALWLTIFRRKV